MRTRALEILTGVLSRTFIIFMKQYPRYIEKQYKRKHIQLIVAQRLYAQLYDLANHMKTILAINNFDVSIEKFLFFYIFVLFSFFSCLPAYKICLLPTSNACVLGHFAVPYAERELWSIFLVKQFYFLGTTRLRFGS